MILIDGDDFRDSLFELSKCLSGVEVELLKCIWFLSGVVEFEKASKLLILELNLPLGSCLLAVLLDIYVDVVEEPQLYQFFLSFFVQVHLLYWIRVGEVSLNHQGIW